MTCGLVHASYRLPEWQAVNLTFVAPCYLPFDQPGPVVSNWNDLKNKATIMKQKIT